MKKQIQLVTFVGEIGLKGTEHQIEPFYKAIKKAAEGLSVSQEGVQGTVRVTCESDDYHATKNWEMKIICPPLPKKHPLHYRLEGLIVAAGFDKRVYSWGHTVKETVFEKL